MPRAALVDLEPGSLDVIKASPIGTMFKPDNFVLVHLVLVIIGQKDIIQKVQS